ncbi:hypothetical protein PROFUN_00988 [Planoprotostelium fungivorum]|uniref:N-terminal Ras-GEF domain-containing protein n=1 Tax=Planoprotostelium fungivorum TaxID=1890364 RepID=A0A2P6N4D2_9EUKA|nr:hypothetical protein PROFUN_00988 [Planoprotostelium fungivorum]
MKRLSISKHFGRDRSGSWWLRDSAPMSEDGNEDGTKTPHSHSSSDSIRTVSTHSSAVKQKKEHCLKQVKLSAVLSDFNGAESNGRMYAIMQNGTISFMANSKDPDSLINTLEVPRFNIVVPEADRQAKYSFLLRRTKLEGGDIPSHIKIALLTFKDGTTKEEWMRAITLCQLHHRKAGIIQRAWRAHTVRTRFINLVEISVAKQQHFRMVRRISSNFESQLRKNSAARTIQTHWRNRRRGTKTLSLPRKSRVKLLTDFVSLSTNESEMVVKWNKEGENKPTLQSATIEKLIDILCRTNCSEGFDDTFLFTIPYFSNAFETVSMLKQCLLANTNVNER